MKLIFFLIDKEFVFSDQIENLTHLFYMYLTQIFNIDEDVIYIYNDKNDKFFSKDLINIALKTDQSIKKSKNHDLIFEISIITSLKRGFLFIKFLNFYLIVDID